MYLELDYVLPLLLSPTESRLSLSLPGLLLPPPADVRLPFPRPVICFPDNRQNELCKSKDIACLLESSRGVRAYLKPCQSSCRRFQSLTGSDPCILSSPSSHRPSPDPLPAPLAYPLFLRHGKLAATSGPLQATLFSPTFLMDLLFTQQTISL